jgi:ABC-type sulfate transport system substrate-binding protein
LILNSPTLDCEMTSFVHLRDTLTVLLALGFVLWMTFGSPSRAHAAELPNVSYDATREFYKELNSSFADDPVYKPN